MSLLCGCAQGQTPRRFLACAKHWAALPASMRVSVRPRYKTGEQRNTDQTLRATPTQAWVTKARGIWRSIPSEAQAA